MSDEDKKAAEEYADGAGFLFRPGHEDKDDCNQSRVCHHVWVSEAFLAGMAHERKQTEKLARMVLRMRDALKEITKVTYGTEPCNTEEENNAILAGHWGRFLRVSREALLECERILS